MKKKLVAVKIIFTLFHLESILMATWILYFDGFGRFLVHPPDVPPLFYIISCIQVSYFLRYVYANFVLRKNSSMMNAMKKNPWLEPLFALVMFNIIHVGGAIASVFFYNPMPIGNIFGLGVYISGTLIVLVSEIRRYHWKKAPQHKGKLYTEGLFRYSMHINYFGEWLLISAYAFLAFSGTLWFLIVVALDFADLYFGNIPHLDKYLSEKYKEQFEAYKKSTSKFIPFVL